jgi:hypothetical protein
MLMGDSGLRRDEVANARRKKFEAVANAYSSNITEAGRPKRGEAEAA